MEAINPITAAAILGTTTATLTRWRQAGKGPSFTKIGARSYLYSRPEVEKFAEERARSRKAVS